MTQYTFKIGDKVKYKESERDAALDNEHEPNAIYTIEHIFPRSVTFVESQNLCLTTRLEPANIKLRHPHADLMIAYANDTSLEIEYKDWFDGGEWKSLNGQHPTWYIKTQYRIKPKPVTKYQVLYLLTDCNEAIASEKYYESEEDWQQAYINQKDVKFIQLIKETAKEF